MSNVDEQISHTYSFQDRGPVYIFTNENIAGYLNTIGDLRGKNILSVAASGDQAFHAYLAGAKHVDTFDINSFQNNIVELKLHMIKYLPYDKFMTFFFDQNNFFNCKIIEPISDKFSKKLSEFIQYYLKDGIKMIRYRAATAEDFRIRDKVPYLYSPDKYYKLRDCLPEKIDFKRCDISEIPKKFNMQYDVILLSNIFEYLYMGYNLLSTEQRIVQFYRDTLSKIADKNLTHESGKIVFNYMWNTTPDAWNSFMDYFNKKNLIPISSTIERKFYARAVDAISKPNSGWDVALIMSQKQK
ncbi:MAG: DUF3419 family protein [Alphaproteobacteria bacterium]|nr:DUF3419 family protein [Alphaproteobacteria bacterium]